jgi:hypothetical protein
MNCIPFHSPSVWVLWDEERADDGHDPPDEAEHDDGDEGGAHNDFWTLQRRWGFTNM